MLLARIQLTNTGPVNGLDYEPMLTKMYNNMALLGHNELNVFAHAHLNPEWFSINHIISHQRQSLDTWIRAVKKDIPKRTSLFTTRHFRKFG